MLWAITILAQSHFTWFRSICLLSIVFVHYIQNSYNQILQLLLLQKLVFFCSSFFIFRQYTVFIRSYRCKSSYCCFNLAFRCWADISRSQTFIKTASSTYTDFSMIIYVIVSLQMYHSFKKEKRNNTKHIGTINKSVCVTLGSLPFSHQWWLCRPCCVHMLR